MEIEIRIVKGRAEIGLDNAQWQFRVKQRGRWSEWKEIPIVNDDAQLLGRG